MTEVGTLKELDVKPGDVVKVVGIGSQGIVIEDGAEWIIHSTYMGEFRGVKSEHKKDHCGIKLSSNWNIWKIISRASDTPKLWRDMTDAEKGALLLAHHDGKVIEWYDGYMWFETVTPRWYGPHAYRVRPEPKIEIIAEEVELNGKTVMLEYTTVDGVLDKSSIKAQE